jgi:hypothetical protein
VFIETLSKAVIGFSRRLLMVLCWGLLIGGAGQQQSLDAAVFVPSRREGFEYLGKVTMKNGLAVPLKQKTQ